MFFLSDSVKVSSRPSDGSVTISFTTGEYQEEDILETFKEGQAIIRSGQVIKVEVSGESPNSSY